MNGNSVTILEDEYNNLLEIKDLAQILLMVAGTRKEADIERELLAALERDNTLIFE